ncbi:MAG: short-chain dehydrogenase/reductase [Candidatus Moranbacteria bacterium CG_4_9_14_3_um_filter_42_9]|nr:MAG: short-chain dehydrogenase/reductase [Candidatus Moranbacteria bacterium CG_4_9_14_3_um_filter_42_9]
MNKQVVVITGCSSGIGYLTALTFARNGWATYATMRNVQSTGGIKLLEITQKEGIDLNILALDVTNQQSVKAAVSMVLTRCHKIDVLVNNAGFGYKAPIEQLTIENFNEQYETNVFGALRTIQAVLPSMKASKSGKIINISSILGLISVPLFGVYSSSKHALESITEVLSYELDKYNIRLSIVEPGTFETEFGKNVKGRAHKTEENKSVHNSMARLMRLKINRPKNAQIVADKIYGIAINPNPNLHYLVGTDAIILNLLYRLTSHKFRKFIFRLIK